MIKFNTNQSDLIKHNGEKIKIIRPLKAGIEYDYIEGESSKMFEAELESGRVIQVFEDELIE